MKNRHFLKVGLILLSAFVLAFINLPADQQKKLLPFTPAAVLENSYHLGLDLQGGSQLDYKMDLSKVPEKDRKAIIDGVMNVINSRVNGLGVSEPNIYLSNSGDEQHLIVELAGIKDLDQAKQIVGKTIQLEFKELRDKPDPNATEKVKADGNNFLAKVQKGEDFAVNGKELAQSNPGRVVYNEIDYQFKDAVSGTLADTLFNKLKIGETSKDLITAQGEFTIDQSGTPIQKNGFYAVKLIDKRDLERTTEKKKEVKGSHILIAYKGALRADASITRTQDEAKARAEEVIKKLQGGSSFEDLAKEYSDDKSNSDKGGVLTDTVVDGDRKYAEAFTTASIALQKVGDVSPATQTEFGFHIIKANEVTAASSEKKIEPQVKYQLVYFDATPDQWQETGLTGQQFVHADVQFDQLYQPYVSIQFNDEGAKLFEEITGRNVGKPLAIFVGGQMIGNPPNVREKIAGGKAQISGNYTVETAGDLARDLNTGAIPAPIILAGQYSIGATLGQDALTKSLWAGIIGFILVAIFMIAYYRLPGVLATVALIVYSMIMLFLIKVALPIWLSITLSLAIFVVIVMKVINSKDSGAEKAIGLVLSTFILFFISFILSTPIVMTLAGIAGVILSIGMAVDANILIFERVKEELRDGRSLSSAIEVGFDRAWNSIRDSNFSSLITCGILFYFGSSIIQGFAFNLAAGILVSMFTAITVTKTLIAALVNTRLAQNLWLFGAPKKKEKKHLPIIKSRKITYYISGAILITAIVGIPFFGLKLGLDFTGGTLMEFKFAKPGVTADQLEKAIQTVADQINKQTPVTPVTPSVNLQAPQLTQQGTQAVQPVTSGTQVATANTQTATGTAQLEASEDSKIDVGTPHIVPSENNSFIIKTRHISTISHDQMIPELKKALGDFEETRFTTVGPTVGESLRYRAFMAVGVASVMIVLYIAFAFRKVPRTIGQWRFGVSAVVALLHDLGIMLGIYVYFGVFFGVEIDALFITAMLTVLGFSVHDTIVVFDRIREKLKYQKRDESFADIANQAVNETIARSINTSFSVFLTLFALAVFGSEAIRFFVLALMVGIVAGTYSSIFVASPILVDWQEYEKKKKNNKK